MTRTIRTTLIVIGSLAAAATVGGALFVYAGIYNIAATEPHLTPTYYLLHYAMKRSLRVRASDIVTPPLDTPGRVERGVSLYRQHCLQCHGAPGVAPEPLAFGVRPEPASLLAEATDWPAREIYWIVRHGVKMSAMPGWQYRLSDQEMWDITAFVKSMPSLSPQAYKAMQGAPVVNADAQSAVRTQLNAEPLHPGDPKAGLHAISQYLCATCHSIPGVAGADKEVGPPLGGIASRRYIGGVLLNTPDNMVRWLRHTQEVDPLSAMPDLNISEQDARDMTAYLYTLGNPPRTGQKGTPLIGSKNSGPLPSRLKQ